MLLAGFGHPSLDLTPAFWIDASDTSSYTVSGTDMTAITDKAGNATITVGGTPRVMVDLDGKKYLYIPTK